MDVGIWNLCYSPKPIFDRTYQKSSHRLSSKYKYICECVYNRMIFIWFVQISNLELSMLCVEDTEKGYIVRTKYYLSQIKIIKLNFLITRV